MLPVLVLVPRLAAAGGLLPSLAYAQPPRSADRRRRVRCIARLGDLLAGEQRADLRDQFRRHRHQRHPLRLPGRLDLGGPLVLVLRVVVLDYLANPCLVPAGRKFLIAHRGFLRRDPMPIDLGQAGVGVEVEADVHERPPCNWLNSFIALREDRRKRCLRLRRLTGHTAPYRTPRLASLFLVMRSTDILIFMRMTSAIATCMYYTGLDCDKNASGGIF